MEKLTLMFKLSLTIYIDKTLMTQYASGSHWDSLDHVNVNAGFCGVQKKRLWGMIRNAKHV